MEFVYKFAGIEDLDILTKTRIEVLRAANKLDEWVDMSQVEAESRQYYEKALQDGSHVAVLVYEKWEDTFSIKKCESKQEKLPKEEELQCSGQLVGAGGVSFFQVMPTYHNPSGKKAYIMNMYTRPQYRRRGIANHTLKLLVNAAHKAGITHISLEATEMGRTLYEKFGFVSMKDEMEYCGVVEGANQ